MQYLPFLRSSGFPFFTVATIISPAPAAGNLFKRPLTPCTAMTNKFLAPVLSAQLITAPTGKPKEIRNLAPAEPPRPTKQSKQKINNWLRFGCTSQDTWKYIHSS